MKKNKNDSTYFIKIVICLILGSLWLKVTDNQSWQVPIPIGLMVGVMLVSHEHLKIDRKLEYAVLLVASFVGFWLPVGIYYNM